MLCFHFSFAHKKNFAFFILYLTIRKWFSVVCTLIDNDIRHHSGQNLLWTHEAYTILTTVMTNIVVDKSTDNAKLISICFLPQYSRAKKVFISERDQNHDTKKEQTLSITFSQYGWFTS